MDKDFVRQLEKQLGYDKITPIQLSPSDQRDIDEKGDVYRQWYEETMWERYHEEEEKNM